MTLRIIFVAIMLFATNTSLAGFRVPSLAIENPNAMRHQNALSLKGKFLVEKMPRVKLVHSLRFYAADGHIPQHKHRRGRVASIISFISGIFSFGAIVFLLIAAIASIASVGWLAVAALFTLPVMVPISIIAGVKGLKRHAKNDWMAYFGLILGCISTLMLFLVFILAATGGI